MSNIRSLEDINGKGSDDDDDRKHNEFYAGGSKSGQVVRGRPEDDESEEEDQVTSLFNNARRSGASAGAGADMPESSVSGFFQGMARTLAGGNANAPTPEPKPTTNHVITFYKNGFFIVNNGPARSVTDPANMAFLASISKGQCPAELDPGTAGAPVTVNLVKKDEDYKEAEQPKPLFQGQGRTLGGGASTSAGAGASAAVPASPAAPPGSWEGADESQPVTSIQIRLKDGTRMVSKFNHTHKVSDVRRFLRATRPDMTEAYTLTTGFPAVAIADEDQTLEAAGLLNAVIIQK